MPEMIPLTSAAPDGLVFEAWRAAPGDARRGGLVLIAGDGWGAAETRALAARFAAEGYETLAPTLPQRPSRDWTATTGDLAASVAALAAPVFVVGFGWGGAAAWLAACRIAGVAGACAYEPGSIGELIDERPTAPMLVHLGRADGSIPPGLGEAIAEAHPEVAVHLYDAGQGFAWAGAPGFDADAARLAHLRTLRLLALNSVGRGEF